jgi:hypothetical protein
MGDRSFEILKTSGSAGGTFLTERNLRLKVRSQRDIEYLQSVWVCKGQRWVTRSQLLIGGCEARSTAHQCDDAIR